MMFTHLFIINSNNVSNYSHKTKPLTAIAALTAGQFVEDSYSFRKGGSLQVGCWKAWKIERGTTEKLKKLVT